VIPKYMKTRSCFVFLLCVFRFSIAWLFSELFEVFQPKPFLKMHLVALTLLTVGAVAVANEGHTGKPGPSNSWIPCFDNLVTFGDR